LTVRVVAEAGMREVVLVRIDLIRRSVSNVQNDFCSDELGLASKHVTISHDISNI
jgi:hypothetical protein